MKRILSLVLLSVALESAAPKEASAQGETYSFTISAAANVAKLDLGRTQYNARVCSSFSLAVPCTQAQACAASFAATGQPASGGSCTAGEAQAANVRIYPNSQAGREGFIANELVRGDLAIFARQQAKLDFAAQQSFCKAATQVQIDALCAANGLSAGCSICDNWR